MTTHDWFLEAIKYTFEEVACGFAFGAAAAFFLAGIWAGFVARHIDGALVWVARVINAKERQ